MTEQNRRRPPRPWTRSAALALAGLIYIGAADARAQNDNEETVADLAVAQDLFVDEELDNFDDPVLVRAKAKIAPPWRGPLGAPPWTERRNCAQVELVGLDTSPFC
jgi:hypothetical protein